MARKGRAPSENDDGDDCLGKADAAYEETLKEIEGDKEAAEDAWDDAYNSCHRSWGPIPGFMYPTPPPPPPPPWGMGWDHIIEKYPGVIHWLSGSMTGR